MKLSAFVVASIAILAPPGSFLGSVEASSPSRAAEQRPSSREQPTRPASARRVTPAPRPVARPQRIMTEEETRAYHRDMTNSKIGD